MFLQWMKAKSTSSQAENQFYEENFVSRNIMYTVLAYTKQYSESLYEAGFLDRSETDRVSLIANQAHLSVVEHYDCNSDNISVIKAIICAGLYPNILRVHLPETMFVQTSSGALPQGYDSKAIKYYGKDRGRVFLHPNSVNFSAKSYASTWLVFCEQRETSKVFVFDCSVVSPYALLLFGGDIKVQHDKELIIIDDWIKFNAPARIAVLVRGLREQLDELLMRKSENPSTDIASERIVQAMLKLITTSE
jgi:ATP-dependent RNA helicase DHX57